MPTLPPYFNGKVSGVLILSVSDITWYKSCAKSIYVQFEWTGSQEKQKLFFRTSKHSKITYDIQTSYKSFLKYLSSCILKCSVNSCENKTLAHTSMKNLLTVIQDNQENVTLPLINNEETVGTLKLCFNLQTFNDSSFDYDINFLKQFGIQNKILNTTNVKEFYDSELFKPRKYVKPVSSLSVKTNNRSKEELTSDYLMGKDMASDEEEEALNTLRIMPSAESLVGAAEKMSIYSPPLSPSFTPLHVEGISKMMTIKPVKNIMTVPTNLKKPCAELHKKHIPKDDIYLHLSVLSINVYHTIKSLQNYINCTYIVQCFKDQEPYKLLRFMSRHMDNNVVRFKNTTFSSQLEGYTVKGVTIKAYVRLLSERNPVVLGETKQMLDWTGFSTTFGVSRYIKVPIWLNNKITGHLCLSYGFFRTPFVQKCENDFTVKHVENAMQTEDAEKEQCKSAYISKSVATMTKKTLEDRDNNSYPQKDQCIYNTFYSESNKDIESQLFLDELLKKKISKKTTKEKEIQTNFELRKLNKSVQTLVKTFNVSVQVNDDELEDSLDKTIDYDVQNIFRCTHEFIFNIKKEFNSNFNYVTYQFPECVTNCTGKVTTCSRIFRTFGNTDILHLITLPTTMPLETYFFNNYKKAAILLNLHRNHDYSSHKISLLISHLIDMAHEFKTSHITKKLILNNNCSIIEDSNNTVHIKLHYKRVYHSFPFLEKNSKVIVDLTESHSEDNSINKTYTLLKHNDRLVGTTVENSTQTDSIPVKMSQSCKTQTEEEINYQYKTIDNISNSIEKKTDNAIQADTNIIVENQANQPSTKNRQENTILSEFNKSDMFEAKVTIVGGYNLPMVKLNGDYKASAPTTYVIMEDFNGSYLSTSYVVEQTNPIWNSQWTVVIPKNKLIEKKWLTLELWCKKYKNEFAGHDVKRDMRLGYILIDLHALQYDHNQSYGLYDVISEAEELNGQIKVIIDPINNIDPQINYKRAIVSTKDQNVYKKSNEDLINEMIEKIQIENNFQTVTKKPKNLIKVKDYEVVDLTENTPQKLIKAPLKKISVTESYQNDCFFNNDNLDSETISSVGSWTSSSDDVLCSHNPQISNILGNETKINQIKQIILS